jgi:S-DNA-T family DNA segregation ATPase FtsK/SpoIIIE
MAFWHKSKIQSTTETPQPTKYWHTPGIDVLSQPTAQTQGTIYKGEYIAQVVTSCGVPCEFLQVVSAPQIATYHFKLNNILDITKLKKPITALSALIHTTVTQTTSNIGHFALVVAKPQRKIVTLRECMLTTTFDDYDRHLRACLGCSADNESVVLSVGNMPHMLIAGATGSGKSVLLNSIIVSLLFSCTPTMMQFVMIDPKKVELSKYEGLPHLIRPIIKSHSEAVQALEDVCAEMDERYNRMAAEGYKKASDMGLPPLVVVIDELADLMLTSKYECEQSIIRIAQLGRAAGIHLIIATQRPTVNVITGLIKSNIPCKIALQTSSIRDSITILDHKGAESLTGKGDALLKLPDRVEEIRFQSAYISDADIENVVHYWRNNSLK